ncbi:MAG: HD domain-containing protein, partial [Bacteroidota bacterium]|nr:HD domain-containing protein [Bacteroidota bacterium]
EYILKRMKKDLDRSLYYHDIYHTLDVIDSSKRIAFSENVSGDELLILLTAAAFHDSGMILSYENHEEASVLLAKDILSEFEYTPDDIDRVSELIMVTKLPRNAVSKLEKIICDADLDYLGREDFFEIASKLKKEWSVRGVNYSEKEWCRYQIDFLMSHKYFTVAARETREKGKKENISKMQGK